MSRPRQHARSRTAALAVLATGALVGGLVAGVTPATAANPEVERLSNPVSLDSGRYIVLLRAPGAATYDGSGRFAATRPTSGRQFDAGSSAARAYRSHLERAQTDLAAEVGAQIRHRYTVAVNGFVAQLSGAQVTALSTDRRVALVQKDSRLKLDTWHTPDFLGLTGPRGAWTTHGGPRKAGDGTVVGILDSGIWPESKSFAGRRLTRDGKGTWDVRRRGARTLMDKADGGQFRGRCQTGEQFTLRDCNRKLIGARYYPEIFTAALPDPADRSPDEYLSPRDGDGHGSHTAGTAAGNHGVRAVAEGRVFGRVSGMAPAAKIAAYKVCYSDTDPGTGDCYTAASVAAIDDAIADGVDVINFSISGSQDTVIDAVEIAFEAAAEAGVFVATSAGNSGPGPETVAHPSPWLTTVAATTHYNFENTVVLGNGKKLVGASIASDPVPQSPLVNSTDAVLAPATSADATLCAPDSLDPSEVTGAIVVCTRGTYDRVAKSAEVARAGGVGMILINPTENSLDADFHAVPTVHLPVERGQKVLNYLAAAGDSATAAIRLGNLTKVVTPVPQVAGFSSRGPSLANDADILKPDLSAPGVSVLAAVAPPTNSGRRFDLYSGTSMASPHVAGLGAFLSAVHPRWTPMQLKSAMMTTARSVFDADGTLTRDPFAQGAGNVRPRRMFNPGLFIESTPREWRGFLNDQGLDLGIPGITTVPPLAAKDINQPSMAQGQVIDKVTFSRRLVAQRTGTWDVSVRVPGFSARVNRERIRMTRVLDTETLRVTLTRTTAPLAEFSSGFVVLDGPTRVRIPVAVRPVSVKAPAEVEGDGTTGSTEVEITAGFTGELTVGEYGLDASDAVEDTVDAGEENVYGCFEVAEGNKAVRVDLTTDEDDSDLDLYVFKANAACDALEYELGESATGSADEQVTAFEAEAGNYVVFVDGYADGSDGDGAIDFRLDFWDVNDTAGVGDFGAVPNPVPVVAGEPTTFDAVWSGLAADNRYLGLLTYEGGLRPTFVTVDTR